MNEIGNIYQFSFRLLAGQIFAYSLNIYRQEEIFSSVSDLRADSRPMQEAYGLCSPDCSASATASTALSSAKGTPADHRETQDVCRRL
jgi:hypothetical protein